ncbi:hypothetical protein EDB86DRAFT_2830753 [Lactarius hatsudake]|nr:hypothetical protein EDB86DRAFT_2830753 [Lactarius hatsudake]
MDLTKPFGEVCTPNGSLKEAHEMDWPNDLDNIPTSNCKSAPSTPSLQPGGGPSTQITLSTFGIAAITTAGQDFSDDDSVDGTTKSVNNEEAQPPKKKKNKTSIIAECNTKTDEVYPTKELPKTSKIHVFSCISEDSHDTCGNKTPNSNDLGNLLGGENALGAKGGESNDKWQFLQLDEMATKDAKTYQKPRLCSSTGGDIQLAGLIGIFKDGEHPQTHTDAWQQLGRLTVQKRESTVEGWVSKVTQ